MTVEHKVEGLTGPEVELAWTALGLQDFPVVFGLLSHGRTMDEHAAAMDEARHSLTRRGLWHRGGPSDRLSRWLHALARPETELDVRGRGPGGRWRALVAQHRSTTVLVEQRDAEFTLTAVTPGSGPAAALATLEPARPGTGQLNAPSAVLASAVARSGSNVGAMARELGGLGATSKDATAMAQAFATAHGSAQIGAAVRRGERRVRADSVVAVLDTDGGRYLVTERKATDGVRWTTYAPAEPHRVHQQVEQLLGRLAGTAARRISR